MDNCWDWVEVNDGTSTQRYCGPDDTSSSNNCSSCDYFLVSNPGNVTGTVTGTTIIFKLNAYLFKFFAVVTGEATVTTDLTGVLGDGKCIIE